MNTRSRIIRPQGQPVMRIILEVDKNGQTSVRGENLAMPALADGSYFPLPAQQMTAILCQFISALAVLGTPNETQTTTQENHHG